MSRMCPGEFRVVSYNVPDFSGDYGCHDYGDPHAPRIARLREEVQSGRASWRTANRNSTGFWP